MYACTYAPRRAAGSLDDDPPEISGLHVHAHVHAPAGVLARVRGPLAWNARAPAYMKGRRGRVRRGQE